MTRLFLPFLFAVKNLLQKIPTLNNKISEVENLTSQFSQINNITGNIKKIKELIEQARDAANRVSPRSQGAPIQLVLNLLVLIFLLFLQIAIPMKFSGTGHVELRPPKNLEDLRAYTSMSLSLQRPEDRGDGRRRRRQSQKGDMFVLYLGSRDVSEPAYFHIKIKDRTLQKALINYFQQSSKNYIGMVVRNNVLYGVYKLNGREYELKTTSIITSPSEPAKFDRVDLKRSAQTCNVLLLLIF